MAAAIYVICEYVISERDYYSSGLHTTVEMGELEDINNNKLEHLKYKKAVGIYSLILYLSAKKDVYKSKSFCSYLHGNYEQELIDIIEKRVEIPNENKIKFLNGFKKLQKNCADEKIPYSTDT